MEGPGWLSVAGGQGLPCGVMRKQEEKEGGPKSCPHPVSSRVSSGLERQVGGAA